MRFMVMFTDREDGTVETHFSTADNNSGNMEESKAFIYAMKAANTPPADEEIAQNIEMIQQAARAVAQDIANAEAAAMIKTSEKPS